MLESLRLREDPGTRSTLVCPSQAQALRLTMARGSWSHGGHKYSHEDARELTGMCTCNWGSRLARARNGAKCSEYFKNSNVASTN